ncbi:hypothetical protein [Stenotrophomonas sp. B1-1]|uniref:hypothetical protein n=1 Tax=Stenotrophomonas sp. B1-1 TaxID=2710648 RepID=UPI0013DC9826|nr:hypothetical protein [Stenotrophomonas sp. B1-1]
MDALEKRNRFESWAKARGLDLHRLKHTKGYRSALTAGAWAAWQAASTPPEGYVLVPAEPTAAMQIAGERANVWLIRYEMPKVWAAMLAARPEVL